MHYRRSGYVWLISGVALGVYAFSGLLGVGVPGVEDLIRVLSQAQGWEFAAAGFVAILFEGLYLVGNFFPGTTTVTLLAIFSSIGSWWRFVATVVAIFIGWCIAGTVNVFLAHRALKKHQDPEHAFIVRDNLWLTWLPAFRANYEVSQVAAGGNVWQVWRSALRVRFLVTAIAATGAAIAAQIINFEGIKNEEGFISLFAFVAIMLFVGWRELQKAKRYEREH